MPLIDAGDTTKGPAAMPLGQASAADRRPREANHLALGAWLAKRTTNRWDNFKNTQWDSMGLRDKVGQDKYLKLQF